MPYNNLRSGRFSQTGAAYHITTATRGREPHFACMATGRKVVREMMRLQNDGVAQTLCYALMPDHLHWLMALQKGPLAEAVRLLKGRSAHAIGQPVWQPNYHDHGVRQDEDLRKIARYIVFNPVKDNLVEQIGDYSLWGAVWLDAESG
jgi:putative transposase